MKSLKLAVLCAASIAAMASAARADDLSELKAEVAALTARMAELSTESNVPAGYKLLTMGKAAAIIVPGFEADANYADVANNIGIRPTADMPEAANLQWSGFVRAAFVYSDAQNDAFDNLAPGIGPIAVADVDGDMHINARGELKLVATNDTAVGEVGVTMKFRGDFDGAGNAAVEMPDAWGWWRLTQDLTFGGGYTGSVGTVGHGGDMMTAMYNGGIDTVAGYADTTQFRLSYTSGPITAAVAVTHDDETVGLVTEEEFGIAGELKFEGDSYSAEVAGYAHEDQWQVGGGVTGRLSDMFTLTAAAGVGSSGDTTWLVDLAPMTSANSAGHSDYWLVSLAAVANFTDSLSGEIGYSYKELEGTNVAGTVSFEETDQKIAGGLYYTPVSQLTIGVEGFYGMPEAADLTNAETVEGTHIVADIVTVFRF